MTLPLRLLLFSTFLAFNCFVNAQPYSAYVNAKGELYTFNGLSVQQLDYLQPTLYKTGGSLVAFIDNTKSLKVYQFGRVSKLNDGYTTDIDVSRDLLLIRNQASIYAYDNSLLTLLTAYSSGSVLGDSIIGFFDDRALAYKLYSDGKIMTLEENAVEFPLAQFVIGSNTFAFTNKFNEFKIWYHGDIYEQDSQAPTHMSAGTNIVAYNDHYGSFQVFYKGQTYELESFPPRRISCGVNLVGYMDNLNELKIFYDGKTYETGVRGPSYYSVRHNLVIYENGSGGLNVFYKGNITTLENFIPEKVEAGDNTLFYFDQANQLKVFSFGNLETLPNDSYESVVIDYDVVQMRIGFNQFRFYYKGNMY